jgi:DnaJ-class molecular chaperone
MKENWEIYWKDYYRILQVHPSAEQEVIKGAYEKLARKYHPDLNKDTTANKRMKDINEAFEVLGDLEKRRQYHPVWLQKSVNPKPNTTPNQQAAQKEYSTSFNQNKSSVSVNYCGECGSKLLPTKHFYPECGIRQK